MKQKYTCSDYRQEMILVGLINRLKDPDLKESERLVIEEQVKRLKADMGMD